METPSAHSREAELALVVLSYRNEDTILAAVDSLRDQMEGCELVVSHSGGGATVELLERELPDVRVVASDERRLPGAARNAGVAATSAPIVGFLEGDCVAAPGWVAGRLRHHRAGAAVVASAVVPRQARAVAAAACLLQHGYRLPHLRRPGPYQRFGASYARELLERFGPFPEDLADSEDTALHARLLAAGVPITWAPEVQTLVGYPRSATQLLQDQYRRGRAFGRLAGPLPWRMAGAVQALAEGIRGLPRGLARGSPLRRRTVLCAAPLLAAGAAATAAGRLRGAQPPVSSSLHDVNARRRARLARVIPGRRGA
jgi:hypothetical protein